MTKHFSKSKKYHISSIIDQNHLFLPVLFYRWQIPSLFYNDPKSK